MSLQLGTWCTQMEYVQATLFSQQPLQPCLVLLPLCLVFGPSSVSTRSLNTFGFINQRTRFNKTSWLISYLTWSFQILTYVVLAAGAVSTEVLYLAYKGDDAITWSDACSSFGSFCHKATASVIITFVVVCFYVVLSLISSYKLFTRFDPPATVDSNKNVEVAVFGS